MNTLTRNVDFAPEPDLHPLYPTPYHVARLLSTDSGLSPAQKNILVTHCMTRACIFADLPFLQYILHDPQAHAFVDLDVQDEDGLVFASVAILGFGTESERDVEREECVRLLISEGADVNIPDKAGWTPLHHAALLAPPTLISHLLTHGCSPLSVTQRNMTALDLVTAYSVIPGRESVALFLEEAMKGEGWQSSKMALQRRSFEDKQREREAWKSEREAMEKILELNSRWWQVDEYIPSTDTSEEGQGEDLDDQSFYSPPLDYSSMLVFSPASLPRIFDSLIMNFGPSMLIADPANAMYMLARFACLTCDHTWLEELVMGATDAIEEILFLHPDDLTYTVFWLYNCTTWLHLMRCDTSINETCELLGSFDLIEEVINTAYVLIIRVAERRIDKLIDTALLDYSSAVSEIDSIQFESEWSLFRSPFSSKKKPAPSVVASASLKSPRPTSPTPSTSRPSSPAPGQGPTVPPTPKTFSSLRQSFNRARGGSSVSSLHSIFADGTSTSESPEHLITFLSALHTLLTESGINPAIITQLWSQVMYWTSSELFNRILTRKRYLCRSRALRIGMNLGVVEEWVRDVGLPRGVEHHFGPARDLLHWLQCLSSMDDFSNLIATIQTMKHLNPLQMRRAIRDYRYEVNESRMSDDCSQYLVQLQKDWERQRVRLGVEALRKELHDRDKEYDDDSSSSETQANGSFDHDRSFSTSSVESSGAQSNIDVLFDRESGKLKWSPPQPPEVLGELLESRYMLPLMFPSNPRLLAAVPAKVPERMPSRNRSSSQQLMNRNPRNLSEKRSSSNTLDWILTSKRVRNVRVQMLDCLDGSAELGRWARHAEGVSRDEEQIEIDPTRESPSSSETDIEHESRANHVRLTRMIRSSSARSRHGRNSTS